MQLKGICRRGTQAVNGAGLKQPFSFSWQRKKNPGEKGKRQFFFSFSSTFFFSFQEKKKVGEILWLSAFEGSNPFPCNWKKSVVFMRTGPSNEKTREIIVDLEKQAKASGKKIWKVLAAKVSNASRRRVSVNLFKISRLAKGSPGKVFVVAGKVLSKGNAEGALEVACLSCSHKAREKIEASKGKVLDLRGLVDSKIETNKMVIVQ